ncbi:MAG: DUF2884 family protein [Candidatus Zixiibacteriota bacterium]
MKRLSILVVILTALLIIPAGALAEESYSYSPFEGHTFQVDEISVNIDDGDILLYNEVTDDDVMINEEYELFVNGTKIPLTPEQQVEVQLFHEQTHKVIAEAINIGIEGGKIGLAGAGLGLKAVAGVFKLLLPGYDGDDLEEDMEREAEKLEKKAEVLESRADKLEELAQDAEDTFNNMLEDIPALAELNWD